MAVSQKNGGSIKKQKNKPTAQSRFYAVFTLALAFALSCAVTLTSLTPKRYDVSEGSVSKVTITAPRMVEDTVMTEALRDAARSGVKTVYSVDTKLADSLISGAQSFFSAVMSYKNAAEEIKATTAPTVTGADGNIYPADDNRTWKEIIPTNDLLAMLVKLPVSITDTSLGYVLLDTSDADIGALQEMVLTTLEEQLRVLDASLSAQQNKLMGLVSESETRVGASRVLSERRENAYAQKKRIQSEREAGGVRLNELAEAIGAMQTDESGQAALSMLDREIEAAQAHVSALDEETLRREEALEAMKNSIIERMNRMSDYRSSVSRYDTMRASIEERLAAIKLEAKRRSDETTRLEEDRDRRADARRRSRKAGNGKARPRRFR